MDCQGLVARLILDFVLLTTAVEVAPRWRELAEKLARVSRQQMEAYEAPHRDRNGVLDNEVRGNISFEAWSQWDRCGYEKGERVQVDDLEHRGRRPLSDPIEQKYSHTYIF